jgi:hypothetical protein
MLHPIDYLSAVLDGGRDKVLMARIALNRVFDPKAYPVDLSEIRGLHAINEAITMALLARCAAKREPWMSQSLVENIREIADRQATVTNAEGARWPKHRVATEAA